MIEIKATGDTTLHTAGKYCEEDILVKVPHTEVSEEQEDYIEIANQFSFNNLNLFKNKNLVFNAKCVINFASSFYASTQNTKVESIELNSPNELTYVSGLFYAPGYDYTMKSITLNINPSKCTNIGSMFYGLQALERIDGTPLDFSSATGFSRTFDKCYKLEEIRFAENCIKVSLSLSDSPLLSDETIQSIINGLATVETAQTLTLHADVKAKLTETQLTAITSKNWTLA